MLRIFDNQTNFFQNERLNTDVTDTVRQIVSDVAKQGDKALFKYTKQFDKSI